MPTYERPASRQEVGRSFGWQATSEQKSYLFVGQGSSDQTSPKLLLRFRQDVIDLHPFAIVIHIGTDDVLTADGVHPAQQGFAVMKALVLPVVEVRSRQILHLRPRPHHKTRY